MASSIPTRCSPRSFERLCNGLVIQGLTTEQTATLLTLAHCTGWSADSISNKIQDTTGVKLTAESVWDTHRDWVWGRGGEQLSTGTTMIMKILLTRAGVNTFTMGAPLSRTFRPVRCSILNSSSHLLINHSKPSNMLNSGLKRYVYALAKVSCNGTDRL
jgi:hypothetical protein